MVKRLSQRVSNWSITMPQPQILCLNPFKEWGMQQRNPQDHAAVREAEAFFHLHIAVAGSWGCREPHRSLHRAPRCAENENGITTAHWFRDRKPEVGCNCYFRILRALESPAFPPSPVKPQEFYFWEIWELPGFHPPSFANCKIPLLFCADDTAILSRTAVGLRRVLKSFEHFCKENLLVINYHKTQILVCGRRPKTKEWTLNEHKIE